MSSRSRSTSRVARSLDTLLFSARHRSMRTLALLDESREEYERRRVLIAQRVAEGSQLQQQVEESRKRVAAAREETAAIRAKTVQTAGSSLRSRSQNGSQGVSTFLVSLWKPL